MAKRVASWDELVYFTLPGERGSDAVNLADYLDRLLAVDCDDDDLCAFWWAMPVSFKTPRAADIRRYLTMMRGRLTRPPFAVPQSGA
jgi:hypothetical protein